MTLDQEADRLILVQMKRFAIHHCQGGVFVAHRVVENWDVRHSDTIPGICNHILLIQNGMWCGMVWKYFN